MFRRKARTILRRNTGGGKLYHKAIIKNNIFRERTVKKNVNIYNVWSKVHTYIWCRRGFFFFSKTVISYKFTNK